MGKNRHIENSDIFLDGDKVKQKSNVKFHGVIVNEKLDLEPHINHCKLNIMSSLFALRNARHCVNIQTCKVLYNTLIYPYLSSGLHLWGAYFQNCS